jgi:GNAT superfamily N-acetyltransferase
MSVAEHEAQIHLNAPQTPALRGQVRIRIKSRPMVELIDVTTSDGRVAHTEWLHRSESVHRQLRDFRDAYSTAMARVFAGGGRMRIAVMDRGVAGVAVYRVYENTHAGLIMYVDDLVTDAHRRSTGVGAALLRSLEQSARDLGCRLFSLDSGTQRRRAHAFYLRERMEITSFHFAKELVSDIPALKV